MVEYYPQGGPRGFPPEPFLATNTAGGRLALSLSIWARYPHGGARGVCCLKFGGLRDHLCTTEGYQVNCIEAS